jgi:hypothetical protein
MIKPMISLRAWFLNWKLNSQKKAVVLENETGCGPVNLEAWNMNKECMNLRSMIKEDGYTAEFV